MLAKARAGNATIGGMGFVERLVASAVLAVSVTGCASNKEPIPRQGGLVAQLGSPSSSATGVVRIFDFRDGVQVQLAISNLMPGAYRVAIHENGNCRSPNLFSAGPAWAPPGWTKPAGDLLPSFVANDEGQSSYVAFVKGVRTEGPGSIRGKSVVIHWGNLIGEAFPGAPNNRMACGVLDDSKPIF
jgi:Cu/Zn superoxide dismutase